MSMYMWRELRDLNDAFKRYAYCAFVGFYATQLRIRYAFLTCIGAYEIWSLIRVVGEIAWRIEASVVASLFNGT